MKKENQFIKNSLPGIKEQLGDNLPVLKYKMVDASMSKLKYFKSGHDKNHNECIFLYTRKICIIPPRTRKVLSLNIKLYVPKGYVAKLYPVRQLYTMKELIFTNSIEKINHNEHEEIKVSVFNMNQTYSSIVNIEEMICQLLLVKVEKPKLVEIKTENE